MMYRWGRGPLSCCPCREKKRRCDRRLPCSSCTLRSIDCRYADEGRSKESTGPQRPASTSSNVIYPSLSDTSPDTRPGESTFHPDEVLRRLHRLEEAVFNKSTNSVVPPSMVGPRRGSLRGHTPFRLHLLPQQPDEESGHNAYITSLVNKLPPLRQAEILLDHFAITSHPNCGIVHIPTCRTILEKTYDIVEKGGSPPLENILLLISIFAGAAFLWSPQLLQQLQSTQTEAKAAFIAYVHLGMSIVDNTSRPLGPSITALAAMGNLQNIIIHARGLLDSAVAVRIKCHVMARTLQVDRLDSARNREERRRKGCNMIDVEVQRRVWWSLVGNDWLGAFSGGPNDGAYSFQPQHMNIRLPANMDDGDISADMVERDVPLSVPTSMTAIIYRVKLSELCREVVDAMPSQFLDSAEPDYEVILQMDKKFRKFLDELPVFFRLDPESVEKSRDICRERPVIALHRIAVNFSTYTRLCRLHRPYHLEGLTNPKYEYSRTACIREAQRVVDLRRTMEESGGSLGMKPARSWIVMQHVSIAALILAADVSFNPSAPNAAERKAKVLATCELLENSIEESGSIMEGVQRNIQTLISTLQKQRPQSLSQRRNNTSTDSTARSGWRIDTVMPDASGKPAEVATRSDLVGGGERNASFLDNLGTDESDWDQLWNDFIEIAPELDMRHWDLLFEDVDAIL